MEHVEQITERGQHRPADWPKSFPGQKFTESEIRATKDKWSWVPLATVADLEPHEENTTYVDRSTICVAILIISSAGVLLSAMAMILSSLSSMCRKKVTSLRNRCDKHIESISVRRLTAMCDRCVHTSERLSLTMALLEMMLKAMSMCHARMCPDPHIFRWNVAHSLHRLHKRNYQLDTGDCLNDDEYKILAFEVKEEDGKLLLLLPPPDDLDALIGTSKWMGKPCVKCSSLHHLSLTTSIVSYFLY